MLEKKSISENPPSSERLRDMEKARRNGMEAFYLFVEKIAEVTEEMEEAFRQNLPQSDRDIFDGFSPETRITIVAYYLLPNFMAQRLSALPAHLPIVHDIRNMISAISIFDSYWN